MKSALVIVGSLLLLGLLASLVMAYWSQKTPDKLGLQYGQLRPCPDSPNCVCSESYTASDKEHAVAPIKGNAQAWKQLKQVMLALGGQMQSQSDDYMHVTFSTSVFHYVDDVECRFDQGHGLIHIRSASRVGRSDFGVNRKRVQAIKKALGDMQ